MLLALTACAGSTVYVSEPPKLAAPDPALTSDCKPPLRLGSGALSQQQVEAKWSRDRKNLKDCKGRHQALRQFYETRDAKLRGEAP